MTSVIGHRINLRLLVLSLCILSVAITLMNVFHSSYRAQHELIINKNLEANRVYADKMAAMTDVYVEQVMSQLKYSAKLLSSRVNDAHFVTQETTRLKQQTDSFNSVYVVDHDGVIASIMPKSVNIQGVKLTSERSRQSIRAKAPLISDPFVSPAGNYLISMTYPIFSPQGRYLGYVGGSIYLEDSSLLSNLLSRHNYKDGSYLYVVDRNRSLIYHPEKSRIGEVVLDNDAVEAVLNVGDGSKGIVNTQGVAMLSGFAMVKSTGWGIIAQTPKDGAIRELETQMQYVMFESIPVGIGTLIFIWISAICISRPLWQLANTVNKFDTTQLATSELSSVKPWYFEASQLKLSYENTFNLVSNQLEKLHSENLTDPMTGLLNRRGLKRAIENFQQRDKPVSVLALDIDHFKAVNDKYGHQFGDQLLKQTADLMKAQVRDADVVCRSGGEEFIIFLDGSNMDVAYEIAERIRLSIESDITSLEEGTTISIGVAQWYGDATPISLTLELADNALYAAKRNGRNRTELFS